jgi:hypothetical protein
MAEFRPGNKTGHGGARPGSGRKPSLTTQLKREHINKQHTLAMDALEYCRLVMQGVNSAGEPMPYKPEHRLEACKIIMDRVWGKPKQTIMHGIPDNDEDSMPGQITVTFARKHG